MLPTQTGLPHCANCGMEIAWRPAIHHGESYCCGGCAQGGPCYCSYDLGEFAPRRSQRRGSALRAPVGDYAGEAR